MKKIAIVGYGVVGKGMKKLLEKHFEVVFFDPAVEGSATKEDCNRADLAVICVPTPMGEDGSCDITLVEESVSWLEAPLILVKSTIAPGTTKYLREKYNKKVNFSLLP